MERECARSGSLTQRLRCATVQGTAGLRQVHGEVHTRPFPGALCGGNAGAGLSLVEPLPARRPPSWTAGRLSPLRRDLLIPSLDRKTEYRSLPRGRKCKCLETGRRFPSAVPLQGPALTVPRNSASPARPDAPMTSLAATAHRLTARAFVPSAGAELVADEPNGEYVFESRGGAHRTFATWRRPRRVWRRARTIWHKNEPFGL